PKRQSEQRSSGHRSRYPSLGHPKIPQEGTRRGPRSKAGSRNVRKRRRRNPANPVNRAVPPRGSSREKLQNQGDHQNARPNEARSSISKEIQDNPLVSRQKRG